VELSNSAQGARLKCSSYFCEDPNQPNPSNQPNPLDQLNLTKQPNPSNQLTPDMIPAVPFITPDPALLPIVKQPLPEPSPITNVPLEPITPTVAPVLNP
jgi:hypothetical protein